MGEAKINRTVADIEEKVKARYDDDVINAEEELNKTRAAFANLDDANNSAWQALFQKQQQQVATVKKLLTRKNFRVEWLKQRTIRLPRICTTCKPCMQTR